MRINERMKALEEVYERTLSEENYIVVRLDGRSFAKLTTSEFRCVKPFDPKFRDCMLAATQAIMDCGIKVIYAYTQSDEISILVAKEDRFFNHRLLKLSSILASTAGAAFTLASKVQAAFDAKVLPFETLGAVVSYFEWRQNDSVRNAINGYAYWAMRKAGISYQETTKLLEKKTVAAKKELLKTLYQINFEETPLWERYGIEFHYELLERDGINRLTGERIPVTRMTRIMNDHLPTGDEYRLYLRKVLNS